MTARILIVDDEPQLLRALRINLTARHYEVAIAADGREALDSAARRVPDLFLLDIGLGGGMDGIDVVASLRGWSKAPNTAAPTVHLTKTEWAVLEVLVRNPGRVVSSMRLLHDVWGASYTKETGYLRFYIAKLRKKLEPDPSRPRQLVTEAGTGYRFQP